MMHLEMKPIGELLLDVLADYGAAYAGSGIEKSGFAKKRKRAAGSGMGPGTGHEGAYVQHKRLFAKH